MFPQQFLQRVGHSWTRSIFKIGSLGACPMLKTCPYFMRGRLRQSLAVALWERSRAKDVGDVVGEERAWKVFGLIFVMLLYRPRGTMSIGREELAKRADDLAHGRFSQLLSRANQVIESQRHTRNTVTDTIERRGRGAQSRVEVGQVSCARQELIGASLAPKTQGTFNELQGKRRCKRFLPPSSLSSPNVRWSLISASSPNVCRAHREEGPQDQEGAATRCGGCVWTISRFSSCSSGLLKISLGQTFRMARAPHSCQQQ